MSSILPATANYNFPQLNVKGDKLIALTQEMVAAGFTYGLGAKIVPLSLQGPDLIGTTEKGAKAKEVDCSGFVRWALYHATTATGEALAIPDGSATQHEWFEHLGFKTSGYDASLVLDNVIRIGFLTPESGGGIGHVVLALNGKTLESHGSHGPDRRVIADLSFAKEMFWFVASLVRCGLV